MARWICVGCELQISQAYRRYVKKAASSRRRKGVRQPLRDIVRVCPKIFRRRKDGKAAVMASQGIFQIPLTFQKKNADIVSISAFFSRDPGGIRTHGLSLRRRKKCSPSLPSNVPQVLDITGFLTISGRSHFLQKPLFYPSAISRKLAELILAVGHFPGSFAKISKLTEITFLKYPQITKKSSVLLNPIPCCNSVHTLDDFFVQYRLLRLRKVMRVCLWIA